jgi:hypothetical protein
MAPAFNSLEEMNLFYKVLNKEEEYGKYVKDNRIKLFNVVKKLAFPVFYSVKILQRYGYSEAWNNLNWHDDGLYLLKCGLSSYVAAKIYGVLINTINKKKYREAKEMKDELNELKSTPEYQVMSERIGLENVVKR